MSKKAPPLAVEVVQGKDGEVRLTVKENGKVGLQAARLKGTDAAFEIVKTYLRNQGRADDTPAFADATEAHDAPRTVFVDALAAMTPGTRFTTAQLAQLVRGTGEKKARNSASTFLTNLTKAQPDFLAEAGKSGKFSVYEIKRTPTANEIRAAYSKRPRSTK